LFGASPSLWRRLSTFPLFLLTFLDWGVIVQLDIFLQIVFSVAFALAFIHWIYKTAKRNENLLTQWTGAAPTSSLSGWLINRVEQHHYL
jgi:hypothetical protein